MLLAIDSSAGASAAVVHDAQVRASWRTDATTTHAEVLAGAVRDVMAQAGVTGAQLDAVVVGVGPGPFTGLRVGLVLAHSLAEVWGAPLHGICSLDSLARRAVAHSAAGASTDSEFLVATDARRREVYWARYRAVENLEGPQVGPAAELPELPAVGLGVSLYPEQLRLPDGAPEEAASWTADAAELGLIAEERPQLLRDPAPLYLRESDAKPPVRRKKATT
ncbi:tRNA (adenosine(37)-N6)-threonylcarbamoyltransferase complex dimerization subunit type 1 TsaB [Nesterenkonia sp. K-15-9-6]|uniref:tRNA (adenosine(37)-N6)-threonylcarbamoyltransferase complex dimerization subunit type 1 TsaB n=1 Tax=Nesterenkonia sp. K-15-9-6 TaxID=3093918 RepID=UPI004044D75B